MAAFIFHSAIQTNIGHRLAKFEQYRTFAELTINIDGTDYNPDLCLYPY